MGVGFTPRPEVEAQEVAHVLLRLVTRAPDDRVAYAAQKAADAADAKAKAAAMQQQCDDAKAAIKAGGAKAGITVADFEVLLQASGH